MNCTSMRLLGRVLPVLRENGPGNRRMILAGQAPGGHSEVTGKRQSERDQNYKRNLVHLPGSEPIPQATIAPAEEHFSLSRETTLYPRMHRVPKAKPRPVVLHNDERQRARTVFAAGARSGSSLASLRGMP